MAYRRTMRRRRGYKRRIMRQVAHPKNAKGPCRSIRVFPQGSPVVDSKMYAYNANLLYIWNLTAITRGDEINMRTRDVVNISGVKLRWFFKNTLQSSSQENAGSPLFPVVVNMAIISRKAFSDNINDEFFRTNGRNERSVGFTDTAVFGWDRAWLPINADKFNVIYHRRFQLSVAGNTGGYSAGAQNCFKRMARYFKINKQFRYRDGTSGSAQDELILVMWVAAPDDGGITQIEDAVAIAAETTVFFRNPTT